MTTAITVPLFGAPVTMRTDEGPQFEEALFNFREKLTDVD